MLNKKVLLIFQVFCFLMVTISAFVVGYYFPNLPPFVRALLPGGSKGAIKLNTNNQPDERFLSWFNRAPKRNIPTEPNIIVSPANGYITCIKNWHGAKHVIIEMRYTDVHVQRVPIDGVVVSIEGEGKKLPANIKIGDYMLKKMLPYQKITTFQTEIGIVKVHQITSFFANRVQVYLKVGQKAKRGQRLGSVLAGSTVVLEVPENVEILVKKNQEVIDGETIIGRY